jgi:hypothetical protein
MIKTKTIGVMLMASSIIDKKLPRRGCRAEHRATDSRLRTRRKRSSLIPEQLSLSSRYFLKRSKIDISQDVKFLSRCFAAVQSTTGPRCPFSRLRRFIWMRAARVAERAHQNADR